jgi:hypothetical protein
MNIEVDPNDEYVDTLPAVDVPDTHLMNAAKSKGKSSYLLVTFVVSRLNYPRVMPILLKLNITSHSMILSLLRICHLLTAVSVMVSVEKMSVYNSVLTVLLILKALIIITSAILVLV